MFQQDDKNISGKIIQFHSKNVKYGGQVKIQLNNNKKQIINIYADHKYYIQFLEFHLQNKKVIIEDLQKEFTASFSVKFKDFEIYFNGMSETEW